LTKVYYDIGLTARNWGVKLKYQKGLRDYNLIKNIRGGINLPNGHCKCGKSFERTIFEYCFDENTCPTCRLNGWNNGKFIP